MQKQVLTIKDIQEMFDVKYSKASQIIRAIKSVSDICGIRGKIFQEDFEKWKEYRRTKC